MALARRGTQRVATSIWPGFVDAMTTLVLVLFFVLSVFLIVQFVLRDVITGQSRELDALAGQVQSLGKSLGLARTQANAQEALIATLTDERADAEAQLTDFEAQVAALIAKNQGLTGELSATGAELASTAGALEATRGELATAERQAATTEEARAAAEAARLREAGLAEELRARLKNSQAELTALTLSLEAERKRAEETLTLLAAAEAARDRLQAEGSRTLTEAERRAAELAQARALLAEEEQMSTEAQRQVAVLNQQTAALRAQLASLQEMLGAAEARDAGAEVQIENLGRQLNTALARAASEERARAELEARERARVEAEAKDLERYRSEFFGRMREILGAREGVQVVGDRFVFPAEVLFDTGSAVLGPEGRAQVARVAAVIREIAGNIPPEINWILRVDGHTDRTPVTGGGLFADNWELSHLVPATVVAGRAALMVVSAGAGYALGRAFWATSLVSATSTAIHQRHHPHLDHRPRWLADVARRGAGRWRRHPGRGGSAPGR